MVGGPARNASHSDAGGEVKIYTMSGKLVRELSGTNTISWDGKNGNGEKVTRGIYLYKITDSSGDSITGKLAITK